MTLGSTAGSPYREFSRRHVLLLRPSRRALRRARQCLTRQARSRPRAARVAEKRSGALFQSAPIVVFTHRPLFDLKPEWEWFTSDGDEVMNVLAPFENVTVLYGHIHRDHEHEEGHVHHYAARSLIFAFPDPERSPTRKPCRSTRRIPSRTWDSGGQRVSDAALSVHDVELTLPNTWAYGAHEFFGNRGEAQQTRERRFAL